MSAALEVTGLSKTFGHSVALREVSFSIPEGSLYGLVGPNGAGKTTLLSLVAGFLLPDSGTISILGRDVRTDLPELRGRFSMLVQDAMLPRNRKIRETLVYLARLGDCPRLRRSRMSTGFWPLCGLTDQAFETLSGVKSWYDKAATCSPFLGQPELIFLTNLRARLWTRKTPLRSERLSLS